MLLSPMKHRNEHGMKYLFFSLNYIYQGLRGTVSSEFISQKVVTANLHFFQSHKTMSLPYNFSNSTREYVKNLESSKTAKLVTVLKLERLLRRKAVDFRFQLISDNFNCTSSVQNFLDSS